MVAKRALVYTQGNAAPWQGRQQPYGYYVAGATQAWHNAALARLVGRIRAAHTAAVAGYLTLPCPG
jgi:hypothetical protein